MLLLLLQLLLVSVNKSTWQLMICMHSNGGNALWRERGTHYNIQLLLLPSLAAAENSPLIVDRKVRRHQSDIIIMRRSNSSWTGLSLQWSVILPNDVEPTKDWQTNTHTQWQYARTVCIQILLQKTNSGSANVRPSVRHLFINYDFRRSLKDLCACLMFLHAVAARSKS